MIDLLQKGEHSRPAEARHIDPEPRERRIEQFRAVGIIDAEDREFPGNAYAVLRKAPAHLVREQPIAYDQCCRQFFLGKIGVDLLLSDC